MRIFVDMDNVLVDFKSGIERLDDHARHEYEGRYDEAPGIFSLMGPMEGAVESFQALAREHDVFILSTAPWGNPSAWSDKRLWVEKYLGDAAKKRLILTHHKYLVQGDVLIDDRRNRGAGAFAGRHIHFGPDGDFADWPAVMTEVEAIS